MANRYRTFVNNQETLMTASDTSINAVVGNLVGLDSNGKVDISLLPSFSAITTTTISGNVSSINIFTAPISGYYLLCVYEEPVTTSALITANLSINFTSHSVARSLSMPALSLLSTTPVVSQHQMIYVDARTAVTYTFTGISSGSLRLGLAWKAI